MHDGVFAHLFLERCEFRLKNLHCGHYDFFRRKSSRRFNGEMELVVVLANLHGFLNAKLVSELLALLAETAIVCILNVNNFALVVEREHLSRALLNKGSSLVFCELSINLLLV